MSVPCTTCEACGNRLRKDGEVLSAYRCPSCGMTFIDGIRYVPYEKQKCETCQYDRKDAKEMKCALDLIEEGLYDCIQGDCQYQSECPQWQEHQAHLKATDLLRRVVDLVSVHLETEHEELYREIDKFLKEAQS